MKITIIGSGNVASLMTKLFKKYGHTITEICGRNKATVIALAATVNAQPCFDINLINKYSDLYVLAVKDDAVAEVASQLNVSDKIVVHTCGSVSVHVLSGASENYGVLYPLQSIRKELDYEPEIPFLIDGSNDNTKQVIKILAASVSSNVTEAEDDVRLQYHLSAIVVSNFSNHLFALTKAYCDKQHINFQLLLPLIEETVHRMHYYDPAVMQTGPAARGDERTIAKHVAMLENEPALKKIYTLITESIRSNR